MAQRIPKIGSWYKDLEDGQMFEVVAVDDDSGFIELQFVGGELTEYDFENWLQLRLSPVSPPEDGRAAYEMADEDNWDPDRPMVPEDWSGPLSSIESDAFPSIEDF